MVLFRRVADELQVLLVHPGGPFWAKKDAAAWSIPKGEVTEGEDLLAAARREFHEETGLTLVHDDAQFVALAPIKQSNKIVHAFSLAVDEAFDISALRSNTFVIEWPPRSGKQQEFPEIDRAEWFSLPVAMEKIHVGQQPLLRDLEQRQALRRDGDC